MEGDRGLAHAVRARLTPAEGRRFALTVGSAFLALAAFVAWRGHVTVATTLGLLGVVLWLAGLLVPARLGPVERAWMALAVVISKVTTPIVMAIVYFGVLTPTGILRRTFGRNPLVAPVKGTLWVTRSRENRSDLTRQF
jgi:hypothetical protein